ncbi:MAG: hypothetical protein PWP39_1363 [Pyrococcus sp.]|nr:hypothetical protein [Pyrococcus sp.]
MTGLAERLISSNKTTKELKGYSKFYSLFPRVCSNKTTKELKDWIVENLKKVGDSGSNKTTKELKVWYGEGWVD